METNESRTAEATGGVRNMPTVPFKTPASIDTPSQDPLDELGDIATSVRDQAYKLAESTAAMHRKIKDVRKALATREKDLYVVRQALDKLKIAAGF